MMSSLRIVFVLAAFCAVGCASFEVAPYVLPPGVVGVDAQAQEATFLQQLEEILGYGARRATEAKLDSITQELQTTFESLPKTVSGGVSTSSARYVTHRLFVQRHGWHIKGLAPESGSWSSSATALGMGDRLPKPLLDLFEQQLAGDDFHLNELALLASALEAFIHGEVVGQLSEAYRALRIEKQSKLSEKDAVELMETYMTAFLTGYKMSHLAPDHASSFRENIKGSYTYWIHYEKLIREVQQEVAPGLQEFTFSDLLTILEAVSERMGRRLDETNCHDIEGRLIQLEEANGTGRVRLRDFYESYVNNGDWQFSERIDYLRQLGVLDESEPSVPRVIVPNYLNMQANCLNVSSFFDLCCNDPCEDLLDHLESKIRAPHASTDEIIALVSKLPSAHLSGDRVLPSSLVKMLGEVAEHHNGMVPLHGRLFAQWMHFAYPRDCAYPHIAGSTKLMTGHEWHEETGTKAALTTSEVKQYLESMPRPEDFDLAPEEAGFSQEEDEEMCGTAMWMPEEELVDEVHGQTPVTAVPAWASTPRSSLATASSSPAMAPSTAKPSDGGSSFFAALRMCCFVALVVSSGMGMRTLVSQAATSLELKHGEKGLAKMLRLFNMAGSAEKAASKDAELMF
mmetsp:Transcript_72041/g.182174  ORF Transcript_72041/g.182174 Transcript_72041/m.182174 type:complete len:627 (+) Transcript_72041:3-1883(+)